MFCFCLCFVCYCCCCLARHHVEAALLLHLGEKLDGTVRGFRLSCHIDEAQQLLDANEDAVEGRERVTKLELGRLKESLTHRLPDIFLPIAWISPLLKMSDCSSTPSTCSGLERFGTCSTEVNADSISISSRVSL